MFSALVHRLLPMHQRRKCVVERNKVEEVPNGGVVVCANAELKLWGDAGSVWGRNREREKWDCEGEYISNR